MARILGRRFYSRATETVARDLLGCTLVRLYRGKRLSGRIIETEAYTGIEDRACHTFGGRRSERVESMYLHGGHAYVYFIYGMHYCVNVVTRSTKHPEAVLIRAIEPLEGIETMRRLRGGGKHSDRDLANGPGKVCQALAIDRRLDGHALDRAPLSIERGPAPREIIASPRIGVAYAEEAALWPLRFRAVTNELC